MLVSFVLGSGERNRSPSHHQLVRLRLQTAVLRDPDASVWNEWIFIPASPEAFFDSSHLATNSNDRNTYVFRSADLCGLLNDVRTTIQRELN
jgi:hypothetical protein